MPRSAGTRSAIGGLIYSVRMARLLVVGVIAVVVLTVYALVDHALTERFRVRALPRWIWVLVMLALPVVGPLLWLVVGHQRTTPRRVLAPDDDPGFTGAARPARTAEARADDEELRRFEQELANLDSDPDDDGDNRRRT
jgi:hypothetical protein